MKQGLSLRTSQHLALTPQLQQSIRLLQLSTLELEQEVEQMLDDNPFLERDADDPGADTAQLRLDEPAPRDDADDQRDASERIEAAEPVAGTEPDWEGDGGHDLAPDDSEWGADAGARGANAESDEMPQAGDLAALQPSLTEHLHRQALALRLSEEDRTALAWLIESLNEDGYLEDTPESLATALTDDEDLREELTHRLTVALGLLQHMEPTGVGARDLAECLRLQLQALQAQEPADADMVDLALCLCGQPLELLARRDVKRLALACDNGEAAVREALSLIARLEPKPGRRFADVERQIVVPDVIVSRSGSGAQTRLRVQLNPDVMPRLRVHEVYAQALGPKRGAEGRETAGLQQRLQEARWFIKNIQQRFDTILRVSSAIVERQRSFFIHGELAMRPLVLREIADELGLHESTISRVTTAKYMATPFGTFELKYFFGSGLGTDSGGNASSTAVRALIRQFVSAEDARRPLSDNQLSEMLKEQGIECARRTVAKYREALKIAPANLRKAI